MVTVIGAHYFSVEPAVDWHIEAELVGQQLAKAGKKRDYAGHGDLMMTLTGSLEGVNCYTDRDTLKEYVSDGVKKQFYSTTISYGTSGSPKSVWMKSLEVHHPQGIPQYVEFIIVLVEETA